MSDVAGLTSGAGPNLMEQNLKGRREVEAAREARLMTARAM